MTGSSSDWTPMDENEAWLESCLAPSGHMPGPASPLSRGYVAGIISKAASVPDGEPDDGAHVWKLTWAPAECYVPARGFHGCLSTHCRGSRSNSFSLDD